MDNECTTSISGTGLTSDIPSELYGLPLADVAEYISICNAVSKTVNQRLLFDIGQAKSLEDKHKLLLSAISLCRREKASAETSSGFYTAETPVQEKSEQPQNTCEQKENPESTLTHEEAEKRLRFILPGWVVDNMVQSWSNAPQYTFAEQACGFFAHEVNNAIGDYTIMLIESGKHACCMIVDALGSFMDIVGDPCFSGPDHLRLNCTLQGLPKMIAHTLPHLQAAYAEYEEDGGQRLKSRDRYVLSKIATPMRLMKKAYSYAEDPRAFACTLLGEAKKIIAEFRLLGMVNPWTVRLLEDLTPAPDIRLVAKCTSPA